MNKPVVLSIGTTHPWNIAGVGLDGQVAADLGLRGASVITGVSAQDENGIREKYALPAHIVRAQFESLPLSELRSIRIGALFDAQNVREVVAFLGSRRDLPMVVDPVFEATLGGEFGDHETFDAFRTGMLAAPIILTPNIPEAQRLLGRAIASEAEMLAAARELCAMGPAAVLIKGGHLTAELVDILVTPHETIVYREPRLAMSMRGTGCVLAAALACELARGQQLFAAVASARVYVRAKISAQKTLGSLNVAF